MKIITWNIKHGGGKRISNILNTLKLHSDADIFVLTEFRNNDNGFKIKALLNELGFINNFSPEIESTKNTVLISAKESCKVSYFSELGDHAQRVIKIENEKLAIYGCYFPQQNEKKHVFDFLLSQIDANKDQKIIITGDINTGKHSIDETGKTFYHAQYLNKFEGIGLTDAWRHMHKDKREYSWYSNFNNGFRIDHFFIHDELLNKVIDCNYIHSYREEKISDHSMMLLELEY
ncbi:hypothetical protein C3K47_10510 [Solitalea longa]|uniref:Endonuclease/exonuclease/phosphatase domain-containing protein n=1 Tax=Solitalea longa TaxID=2079460 RepID=A0A2S5A396_9SPHI|nr:endonuclease/exonuclease/phosphatase family protein [Solitalea longa]POY36779.1 hypothetical protein C3K47_10510 [Solitalea longa]